jgi:hypothetical protein
MTFSQYWDKKLMDQLFKGVTGLNPTVYVAVSTANPLSDNSGDAEPSGSSYARVSTATSDWNSCVLSTGQTTNANAITFPQASGSWGTLTYFALFDASTSGNQLGAGALTASKTIGTNDTLSFASTNATITLV